MEWRWLDGMFVVPHALTCRMPAFSSCNVHKPDAAQRSPAVAACGSPCDFSA